MSILSFLDNQTVDPTTDGSVSDLDDHAQDDTIDLRDDNTAGLAESWDTILSELEPEAVTVSDADQK